MSELHARSTDIFWGEGAFAHEIAKRGSRVLVGRQDGLLIGFGVSWLVADELQIVELAVAPAKRRRGLGRALLRALLDDGRKRGALRATLEVAAPNENALGLYRSEGFVETGRRSRYYNRMDAILMEKVW